MRKYGIISVRKDFYSIIIAFAVLLSLYVPVLGENSERLSPVKGKVVIFAKPKRTRQMKALSEKTISFIKEIFDKGERFVPVENHRVQSVYKNLADDKNIKEKDLAKEIAFRLNVAVFVLVDISYQGGFIYARMDIMPREKYLAHLKKQTIVRSKIHLNIPFKLGREVIVWHQKQRLIARIEAKQGNKYIISAGQWHGIGPGEYTTKSGRQLWIIETGRYRSIARIKGKVAIDQMFIINHYPDLAHLMKRVNNEINYHIHKRYALENSLLRGQSPEKRLLEGICCVNLGANVCLPVYGSFLSTGYMGFDPKSPDFAGMIVPLSIVALQFTATEFLTSYKTNFAPWIKDSDKDKRTQRLQTFLWATLPLTFSATYMDQLSRQFTRTRHLPPYFQTKDLSAMLFSLFIPGGGLFYKGHRVMGWSYYTAELALASYGIYYLGKGNRSLYAFSILGALKLIEFFHAYITKPAYNFYNIEKDGDYYRTGFSVSFNVVEENRPMYTLAVNYRY